MTGAQGQLVLDNNPPRDARTANCHGATTPSRTAAALAATAIASTASPTFVPVGEIGPNTGSKPCASTVNHTRINSAFAANRRNQPRTVAAGTPTFSATRR